MKLNVGLFNESFPPTVDGVSNTVFNYAKYIQQNHGNATVVTPKYPNVKDDYDFEVYRYSSADVSEKIGYRVGNVLSVKTVRDLSSKKFDIMHIHSPFASSIIVDELRKIRANVPVVFTYHTKFDIDFKKRLKLKGLCKVAEKFICHNINRADEVWVVSEGAVESLRNIGYKGDYRVMKNGTDFAKGKSSDEDIAKLRERYGIKPEQKMLLFVGRMMWYKNTRLILDALKKIDGKIDYKTVFVGDGMDKNEIEAYAAEIGLADKTVFTGAITDRELVRTHFSAADLFLFPSTYDTAGLVVMEAAACDLPSVLVDGSCAAEDVVDDFSGFLCQENPQSLANKIKYAFSDENHLREVGKNAGEFVYLSWEESVARAYKRYCELYNEFHRYGTRKSVIERVRPSNVKQDLKKMNSAVKSRVTNAGRTASSAAKNAVGNVGGKVKNVRNKVRNHGSNDIHKKLK